ncbi:MAG TPA: hypothetical protein VF916_09700 [Ktedonobacterales bacterium]|jgi:hypothetical protein
MLGYTGSKDDRLTIADLCRDIEERHVCTTRRGEDYLITWGDLRRWQRKRLRQNMRRPHEERSAS